MRPCLGVLLAAFLAASCTLPTPLPWRLIELGHAPLTEALGEGQWILAQVNGELRWLPPDTLSLEGAKLRRDLVSLPNMACGDLMMAPPDALPQALKDALAWQKPWANSDDSLLLRWTCFDRSEMTAWFQERISATTPDKRSDEEARWVELLERAEPSFDAHAPVRYKNGNPIRLRIVTTRADGTRLGPDTVRMAFQCGDSDQVVPALMSGLFKAGPGSQWSTWSTSKDAFGIGPHPNMGLPPHAPLQFFVWAD